MRTKPVYDIVAAYAIEHPRKTFKVADIAARTNLTTKQVGDAIGNHLRDYPGSWTVLPRGLRRYNGDAVTETAETEETAGLVEGEDYLVIDEHPTITTSIGTGTLRSVKQVLLADDNSIVYLCMKCNTYTNERISGVTAHQRAHAAPKADVITELKRKAALWDSLPAAFRAKYTTEEN